MVVLLGGVFFVDFRIRSIFSTKGAMEGGSSALFLSVNSVPPVRYVSLKRERLT